MSDKKLYGNDIPLIFLHLPEVTPVTYLIVHGHTHRPTVQLYLEFTW